MNFVKILNLIVYTKYCVHSFYLFIYLKYFLLAYKSLTRNLIYNCHHFIDIYKKNNKKIL